MLRAPKLLRAFEPRIEEALTEDVDHKTGLQEELARRGLRVEYVTLETDGPPHDRTFRCAAVVDGEQVALFVPEARDLVQQADQVGRVQLGGSGVAGVLIGPRAAQRGDGWQQGLAGAPDGVKLLVVIGLPGKAGA